MADVVGKLGAPLYGMLDVDGRLQGYTTPDGQVMSGHYFGKPADTSVSGFKWDGEWEVTYVTFRDMGLAFMAALVLIYILVVAEFKNFILPLVVMAPIPLTLIGIVPGHWLLNADFTATSMIGFIALAGIIVRNSILLVEFAMERVQEGMTVRDAVVLAAEVRMRPIMITALALVIGSVVLLTDPIFQGMAVSLLFGSLVATFLTLVVIPLGCLSAQSQFCRLAPECGVPGRPPTGGAPTPGGTPSGGLPPGGGLPPSGGAPAPGRPTRLARKGDVPEGGVAAAAAAAAAAVEAAVAPEPEAAPGRPARLLKRAEAVPAAQVPSTVEAGETVARPPRLVKRSEAPAPVASPATPGERPARLEKRAEAAPAVVPAPTAPPGRPARLVKRAEATPSVLAAEAPAPLPAAVPEAGPESPTQARAEPVVPEAAPGRPDPGRHVRVKKAIDEPKPAKPVAASVADKAGKAEKSEAEGRERKFVARAKPVEPPSEAAPPTVPAQAPAAPAADTVSDKLAALQTGKKKLRGIRINPDLE
jgi:hypothetical protein